MRDKALEVRRMQTEDLEEAAAIEAELFSLPWSRESLEKAISRPENCYLAALCDGRLVGYCGMWRTFEEANITNVAVAKPFRRRGIASGMLRKLLRIGEEEGVSRFFLEVRESNQAALSLYESLGFARIGIRKRFYEHPVEDAVIMERLS